MDISGYIHLIGHMENVIAICHMVDQDLTNNAYIK
jgi:hypothetical protein